MRQGFGTVFVQNKQSFEDFLFSFLEDYGFFFSLLLFIFLCGFFSGRFSVRVREIVIKEPPELVRETLSHRECKVHSCWYLVENADSRVHFSKTCGPIKGRSDVTFAILCHHALQKRALCKKCSKDE